MSPARVYGWSIIHAIHALSRVERAHAHAMLGQDRDAEEQAWEQVCSARARVFRLFAGRSPTTREATGLVSRNEWCDQPCPACKGEGSFPNGVGCPSCDETGRITRL